MQDNPGTTNSISNFGNTPRVNKEHSAISTDVFLDFNINGRTFICGDADNCWADLDILEENLSATNVYWTTAETKNSAIMPKNNGNVHFTFFSFGQPQQQSSSHFIVHVRPFNNVLHLSTVAEPATFITNNNFKEIPINITEYGNIGQFLAGNFSGRFYEDINGTPDITKKYDVECSFRIKRNH